MTIYHLVFKMKFKLIYDTQQLPSVKISSTINFTIQHQNIMNIITKLDFISHDSDSTEKKLNTFYYSAMVWNPDSGNMNVKILVEGFMDIIIMQLVFPLMCGNREEGFWKLRFSFFYIFDSTYRISQFRFFLPEILYTNSWPCSF